MNYQSDNQVLIMMASFNSEKYIEKQINSIQKQTYKNWSLIIQDDGSTDDTLSIVKRLSEDDARINIVKNETGFHGAYINFHVLLQKVKKNNSFAFYMFSDHDDIWDTKKIQTMIAFFKANPELLNSPSLIYGDMRIIDGNDNVTSHSLNSQVGISFKNNISTFFSHNVYGCNTMFNWKLIDRIPSVDVSDKDVKILSHDNFLTKLAATYGNVSYLPKPLMSYRRYFGNVTMQQSYSFNLLRIVKRVFNIDKLAKDHALTYKQTITFIKLVKNQVNMNQENFLKQIEETIVHGGISGMIFLIKNRVSWGKPVKTISRLLIFLSGRYKKFL